MADYKINKQVVTESEWTSFKKFIDDEFPSVKCCFDDSEVSKDEILGILDADGNGLLDYADFIGINEGQFSALDNILKKHGFSIGKEVGQNASKYKKLLSVPSYMWKDKQFVLAAVKQNGWALEYADESLKKDREFVLAAVKQNGYALAYADELFKKDKDVVLAAVKEDGWALQFADESLKKDREFVLAAVEQNGWALEYADELFKKDKDVVLAAVKENGYALTYADESLKKDREIVLIAVKENGWALAYADESLKKDKDIVLAAVKQNGRALEYAHESLKKDKDVVLAAVKQNGCALKYSDKSLKKDKDVVLAAVKQNGRALEYADESLKKDKEFVLAAVKQNGWALKYADESLKKDKDVVLAAVKQNGRALEYADESLIGDPDFIYSAACVRIGILNYKWISEDVKKEAWAKILKECNDFEEINPPASSLATFESFKEYIKEKYDIEFLDRFRSIDNLIEVLKIRGNPLDPGDTRPLAVIISPKKDWNGSLAFYPLIDRLIELGYKVAYYEAGDEATAEGYLSEATDGGKTKADIIVLSGHGSSKTLSLGGDDLGSGGTMTNEKLYIDTGDFEDGKVDIKLAEYLSPNGDLILNSCLNGAGGSENPANLANTIAGILPKGVTIHASDQSMNIHHIGLDDAGKPKVEWTENSLYTPNGNGTSGN